jgi:hypothetical protein
MLPEFAPGKLIIAREPLKVLDDGRDHGKLPDLADAEVKDRFLDIFDRPGHAVINGIDHAQEPGGQAGIAPDDFRDLGGVALVRAQEFLQRGINGAQRRQVGAPPEPIFDLLKIQRPSGNLLSPYMCIQFHLRLIVKNGLDLTVLRHFEHAKWLKFGFRHADSTSDAHRNGSRWNQPVGCAECSNIRIKLYRSRL